MFPKFRTKYFCSAGSKNETDALTTCLTRPSQSAYAYAVVLIDGTELAFRITHGASRFNAVFLCAQTQFDHVGLGEAAARLAGRESGTPTSFSPAL
jgi:hypothetical protein